MDMSTAVKMADVKKSVGSVDAVRSISWEIPVGEIFGLLGPNGAGKTTTINMVSSLLEPDSGHLSVFGWDAQRAKSMIGVVPQEIVLYEDLTLREHLLFWGSLYNLSSRNLRMEKDRVLEIVQLRNREKHLVKEFSGGMKRRANMACALLHRPKLLLLDEPTVGVDPQSRNHIFESIKGLSAEGTTILYTTHYMEEADALCSRVAIMDHGQLIANDEPRNLIDSYGAGIIKLKVDEGSWFVEYLTNLDGVDSVTTDAQYVHVRTSKTSEVVISSIQALADKGLPIRGLHILEPSLESVFLALTGRSLRE
jgi:ABC-2 type transport system ATP-binding protein